MLKEKTLDDLLDEISKKTPTPGGGSVCGIVSSLSTSLTKMALNFSKDIDKSLLTELDTHSNDLLLIAEKDIENYSSLNTAFKMDDSPEKKEAVIKCTKASIDPPLNIMKTCLEVKKIIHKLAESGNKNLISDVFISKILITACMESAYVLVLINLKTLMSPTYAEPTGNDYVQKINDDALSILNENAVIDTQIENIAGASIGY